MSILWYFNSHPHEEDDDGQVRYVQTNRYFNSHPHEEDDGSCENHCTTFVISTHILTKRMTSPIADCAETKLYFNSHPHEEDDWLAMLWYKSDKNFNSHPHEEDDGYRTQRRWNVLNFNSHPHEEDDYNVTKEKSIFGISTHILTKRMT